MEYTASHETIYKLAHRADKANFLAKRDATILTFVQFGKLHKVLILLLVISLVALLKNIGNYKDRAKNEKNSK
jgi:hypothetical protein